MGLGIDIGASSIKVLEIERKGDSVRVIGGGRVRWQDYSGQGDDRAAQQRALMTILSHAGEKYGTAYAGATGRDVNLRFTQVPNVPSGLSNLIAFEVQQVKGKTGAVYCDSALLSGEPGAAELPLLVGLIRTEYADARVNFLQQCRAVVKDVVPNALALYEVFLQSPECKAGETVLLADIGAENIDIIIVEDRRLSFARNIGGGGKTCSEAIASMLKVPLAEGEKSKLEAGDLSRKREADERADQIRQFLLNSAGQIATLVSGSISFARTQTKRALPVSRVLLSGGGARLAGFDRFLSDIVKLPVSNFDPFTGWEIESSSLPPGFFAAPSDLAVAAGLALMASGKPATTLSFLPQQMRDARDFKKRGAVAIAGAALLLLAALVQTGGAFGAKSEASGRLDKVKAAKADLDANSARCADLLEERDKLRRKVDLLCRETEAGGFMLRALQAARETKLEGLWISEAQLLPEQGEEKLARGYKVILRGLIEDPQEGKGSLEDYRAALQKHPLGLAVRSLKFEKQPSSSLFEFELELQ
ncbi:MAG: pilus-associated protein [Planctomycetota bacterium]|nr:MAG: pilus-associated protein [Planctomycetota bacterium]